MRHYYGKRNYVPSQCPVCGTGSIPITDFNSLLKQHYGQWNVALDRRRPDWHIPSWYGRCGSCTIKEQIVQQYSLWDRIVLAEHIQRSKKK